MQEITDAYKSELAVAEADGEDGSVGLFPAQELLAALGAAVQVHEHNTLTNDMKQNCRTVVGKTAAWGTSLRRSCWQPWDVQSRCYDKI